MTPELTSKEIEFVNQMAQSEDKANWGFDLLLKRIPSNELDRYFDQLNKADLFQPKHNLGPVPAKEEGLVHIPYWPALNYLEAIAKISGDRNDVDLADKIMTIVRTVTRYEGADSKRIDNFHTSGLFAKIIGLVPLSSIETKDIDLIPLWLDSKYDRGTVAPELSKGILCRLLEEGKNKSLVMACRILFHCTALRRDGETSPIDGRPELKTVVDDYCLEHSLKTHLPTLAASKIAKLAADLFVTRLTEIFANGRTLNRSDLKRSAIENSDQNLDWEEPVNFFVEGLRDILSEWVEHDLHSARAYINKLKDDKTGIIRRIVIHTLNYHWEYLNEIYDSMVSIELFQDENFHEIYELLNKRFGEMTQVQRCATLDTIRNLPAPDYCENHDKKIILKREQHRWLSSVVGKGDEAADKWYEELNGDENIGESSAHPNFLSYMESSRGPGPSFYTVQDLLVAAKNGTLIDLLNNFKETDSWRGPTIHALADTLVEAIKQDPQLFIGIITKFIDVSRPYQYGLIKGYKQLWDVEKDDQKKVIDWNETWEKLIEFFNQLLSNEDFWQEPVSPTTALTPSRDWIAPEIARFLNDGTRDDSHSYASTLLPQAWKLILILMEKTEPVSKADKDAMNQAINSTRGKVIEALFSHTLRACRVSDKENGDHDSVWTDVQPVFDSELNKCAGTNFEFSTLCGAYLANLAYIKHSWVKNNIKRIFSDKFPENCRCALIGLAYSKTSRPIIRMLIEYGVFDLALSMKLKSQNTRKILLQWIALAYLWEDEELEEPRFKSLFTYKSYTDLQVIANHYFRIRNEGLKPEHKKRIIEFWNHTIDWIQTLKETPTNLLSSVCILICYLETLDEDSLKNILIVIPHIQPRDCNEFIPELDRLFENNPVGVCQILCELSKTYDPHSDYQNRLKLLIKKIANHSSNFKIKAKRCVNRWASRSVQGMTALFNEL